MKWLRRLLKPRRDPRSLHPMRPVVRPEDRYAQALERRMSELDYEPQNGFHKDQVQERAS